MTEETGPKPITPRPDWASGDYEGLVKSWGYTVRSIDWTGVYQGDILVLLGDDAGRIGFTLIGYGSCPGCDAIQAAEPWGDDEDWSNLIALAEELRADIVWRDSATEMLAYIDKRLASSDWYTYDEQVVGVMRRYRDLVIRGDDRVTTGHEDAKAVEA